MKPTDRARLDRAWERFLALKRQRQAADRKGLYGDAATLEREEKQAHADIGHLRHQQLGLDE